MGLAYVVAVVAGFGYATWLILREKRVQNALLVMATSVASTLLFSSWLLSKDGEVFSQHSGPNGVQVWPGGPLDIRGWFFWSNGPEIIGCLLLIAVAVAIAFKAGWHLASRTALKRCTQH